MQIINGTKTIGDFMAFFAAIALVFEPLRRLGKLSGAWQKALVSMERVYNVFQVKPTILSPTEPANLRMAPEKADIEFDNVQFAYGDNAVLDGVSFTAKAGQTTALVGASGAGKTTVFKALTRLIDPACGRILLGGTEVRAMKLPELRGLFSVVTQDTQLFDETIRDNILLGQPRSSEALDRALTAAHVAEFLSQTESGLDSGAGPRGSNLSGGQRQRVAIARALLRDTPFLLLDEATSALDTKSEAVVQDALETLSEGRTTLVIAHRLSTIRNAEKIVVMDQGRVVDQGTHDELIARDGLYAGLYRIQFRDTV
jgi:ABC-type multidrug transport system fused ATPase/permease subunit